MEKRNISEKVNNVVKLLSKLPTNEVRHFTRLMRSDVLNEIANRFGVEHNSDSVALAISQFGRSVKNLPRKEEIEEVATELKEVA